MAKFHMKDSSFSEEESISLDNSDETSEKYDCSYEQEPEDKIKSEICLYFKNYGYCKFGNGCKYKHFKKEAQNSKHNFKIQKVSMPSYAKKYTENENILKNSNNQAFLKQKCRYFHMGNCKKGENCNFLHSVDSINNKIATLSVSVQSQHVPKKAFSSSIKPFKNKSAPLCHYFKRGLCYKGDNCKYFHQNRSNSKNFESFSSPKESNSKNTENLKSTESFSNHNMSNLNNDETFSNAVVEKQSDNDDLLSYAKVTPAYEDSASKRTIAIFNRTLNVYDLSLLTIEAMDQLRSTEINQLKKRFPHLEVIIENKIFSLIFEPSDPDWGFDVNKLKLQVDFPAEYPRNKCDIKVLQNAENIPLLLIKYLDNTIYEWIDKRFEENNAVKKVELVFRPFLKWFDKNLEDLFISGLRKVKQDLKAKEDGIEFVPTENLFPSTLKNDSDSSSSPEKNCEEKCAESIVTSNFSQPQEQVSISNDNKITVPKIQSNTSSYYSSNNGMKIILMGLEFIEGTAAFVCTKISTTLQCSRCKTSFNIKSVPKKNNSHICSKCSKVTGFTFEPSTVHQFSSILGTFHLVECVAVDINLVECHFLIDCLNCSKQVPVDGIHYGQKHKMWCIFCNEKMLVCIGSVKFQSLRLSSAPVTKYPSAKRIDKRSKDPVVKEGEPLPNFGACKHYKKSFRWLRFPCCGRLYPCDVCHDEKETDHEMKYASRMLCGFCAKEQPYSKEKPCISCSQSVTKSAGCHWEGGKGCRNKIQMSREDKQKYSGMSKTVSKKAQMNKPKKKH